MTPLTYHRFVTALIFCILLLAPLASAVNIVEGSKTDTHTFDAFVRDGQNGDYTLKLATTFGISKVLVDEFNDINRWEQKFGMMQGANTYMTSPRQNPAKIISNSYGKVISSSPNLITNPIITRDEAAGGLTGGSPLNNPSDQKMNAAIIGIANHLADLVVFANDESGTQEFIKDIKTVITMLKPIWDSPPRDMWTVAFDHKTDLTQYGASTSSHYITFETFTTSKRGNTPTTHEQLIDAGTAPACFTYESGMELSILGVETPSKSKISSARQTLVFVRSEIDAGKDPSSPGYNGLYSFRLAPDSKSCTKDTGEVSTRFTRTEQSLAPQRPTIGDELEQVLDAWGTTDAS